MSALWIAVGLLAAIGVVVLVRSVRALRAEVAPTVRAFGDLRAALVPATVAVRDESRRLRARLDGDPGARHPQR